MSLEKIPPYGIYPVSTVRDVADSLGFEKTSDPVCRAIAGDVEFRLSMIIQEAKKFMRHAKRGTMLPVDVEYALQALNVQPILHPPAPLSKPTFLPVFSPAELKSNSTTTASSGPTQQLYYLQDEEIDLAAFLKGAKEVGGSVKAKEGMKSGVTWRAHWLAVEGVQPLVKENPVTEIVDPSTAFTALHNLSNNIRHTSLNSNSKSSNSNVSSSANKSTLLARNHLSQELQLLFSRLTEALVPDPVIAGMVVLPGGSNANASGNAEAGPSRLGGARNGTGTGTATFSETERTRQAALSTLLSDSGLGEILPYLIRWMSENILSSVTSGPSNQGQGQKEGGAGGGAAMGKARSTVEMGYLLDGLEALVENQGLFIEPYLHQFLPPIMSILLSVPLGAETHEDSKKLSSKDLRAKAADLLGKLMKTYASDYETLLPRVIKTLNRALSSSANPINLSENVTFSSVGRYQGALYGLKACGKQAVVNSLLKRNEAGGGKTGLRELEERVEELELAEKFGLSDLVGSNIKFALEEEQISQNTADLDAPMNDAQRRTALRDTFGPLFGESLGALDGGKWGTLALRLAE